MLTFRTLQPSRSAMRSVFMDGSVVSFDLPTQHLPAGTHIRFTFYWHEAERWEGMGSTLSDP
jgi:hypothetical protein